MLLTQQRYSVTFYLISSQCRLGNFSVFPLNDSFYIWIFRRLLKKVLLLVVDVLYFGFHLKWMRLRINLNTKKRRLGYFNTIPVIGLFNLDLFSIYLGFGIYSKLSMNFPKIVGLLRIGCCGSCYHDSLQGGKS